MPVDPKMMGGMMGGMVGAPKIPSGAGPEVMDVEDAKEEGSITAVKDLLQQAMDMLSSLDTEDDKPEDMGSMGGAMSGPSGVPPTRPPMNLRG